MLSKKAWQKYTFIHLIPILLLGAVLRIYNLGAVSLWFDEALDMVNLNDAISGKVVTYKNACFSALPVFFNYFWRKLGSSEFLLRLPAAIFGVFSIAVVYFLGKMFFNKKTGLFGALLFAISPLHIYYSQELRMYSGLVLLILLSLYFLKSFLEDGKFASLLGYSIFIALSIYTHYIALLTLLGGNIFFLLSFKKYKYLGLKWIKGQVIVILLMSPILLLMFSNLSHISKSPMWWWVPAVSWKTIFITLMSFNIGYNASLTINLLACILCFPVFVWGGYCSVSKGKGEDLLLLLCYFFIPISIIFLISIFKPYYVDRYFIPGLPVYLLIIAKGLSELKKKYLIFFICAIFVLTFFALKNYYSNFIPDLTVFQRGIQVKTDTKSLARYIYKNFKQGDIICHANINTVPQILYYLSPEYKIISDKGDKGIVKANKRIILEYNDKEKNVSLSQFVRGRTNFTRKTVFSLASCKRIWFVCCTTREKFEDVLGYLAGKYPVIDHKEFYGLELYLYDCNAAR